MKKDSKIAFCAALAFVFFTTITYGQPPKGDARPGDVYGEKFVGEDAEDIRDLPGLLSAADTVTLKVKARVVDVCSKKGCWLTLRVNDSTEAFVKMKDYGFFVPLALRGKNVVIAGTAFTKTTSVAELRHYAEDAGKPAAEIEAIHSPQKELRLLASGIVVVE